MSQAQIQPHEQNLLGQYREIGPAVLVAALMNSSHKSRKIQIKVPCNSILADKKTV
ncbi:hydrolase [Daeguia caeni]|uniref:Hydrolase n=1 Tax=Daeguia caeni TaxID=439612 RepID=A0ABV9H3U1_9HYPH